MQSPEPLIHWSEPVREYIGFIAQFLALGSVGFRFAALRNVSEWNAENNTAALLTVLARRAARLGLLGFAVQTVMFFMHDGAFEGGAATATLRVVSGTDELAGASGSGKFRADPAGSLTLDLDGV